MNDIIFHAFQDELEKLAVSATWVQKMLGRPPTHTVPRPRNLEDRVRAIKGYGAVGKRHQFVEALQRQPGYAKEVQAPALKKRTENQLNRIGDMLYERRQRARPPVLSTNPKSVANASAFAKEMNAYDDVLQNVVDRKTVSRTFGDGPVWG